MCNGGKGLRLLVAAGGTGGHVFPGVAVAQLARDKKQAEVLFVGGAHGLEHEVVPRCGFPLKTLAARGLRGKGPLAALGALWAAARSLWRSLSIIKEFEPDVIIGIGGYASGPAVLAGWRRGVPCVLLEPNAKPGLTNRLLGRLASRICVGFPETAAWFPAGKVVCTGNPVRWAPVRDQEDAPQAAPFTLLVFGGSAGAQRLNLAMCEAVPHLGSLLEHVRVVHQTGAKEHEAVVQAYRRAGVRAEVLPFIHDMRAVYLRARLVVSRAGATTVAELTVFGIPSILVPYPYASDDHQRANAEVLVRAGAAVMIADRELSGQRLAGEIRALLADPPRLSAMSAAALAAARPRAAEDVVEESVRVLCRSCSI